VISKVVFRGTSAVRFGIDLSLSDFCWQSFQGVEEFLELLVVKEGLLLAE